MCRFAAILAALGVGLGLVPVANGWSDSFSNWWPGPVRLLDDDDGRADLVTALGPFWTEKEEVDSLTLSFRPWWTELHDRRRDAVSRHLLYPFFNHYAYPTHEHWHLLNLARGATWLEGEAERLEVWPFYFWQDAPGEENDQLALWPLGGTLRNFFGRDEVEFWAWPLYIRTERPGETRYSTPWPFVQWRTGEASGAALWPLFGRFRRPDRYDHTFAAWPLYYDHRDQLDREVPRRRFGILPFYTRETAAGLRAETYLWPFFGYTEERAPRERYDETRYFWPLLVQGRGEAKHVNRWLPLYTHERRGAAEKWWYLWPFLKREEIDLGFLTRHRSQFLFFLYRDERQTDGAGFSARRQYLWPFYSYWNNGEGRRQIQALDPFTVFFPQNRKVAANWTPLFAIFRYDERPRSTRQSWLWNLIVIEDAQDRHRLSVGPFYRREAGPGHRSWSVLHGLVAREQSDGETHWRVFWQSLGRATP